MGGSALCKWKIYIQRSCQKLTGPAKQASVCIPAFLRQMAFALIQSSTDPQCVYITVDPKSDLPIEEHITPVWISRFMQA